MRSGAGVNGVRNGILGGFEAFHVLGDKASWRASKGLS